MTIQKEDFCKIFLSTCYFIILLCIIHSIFLIAWNTNDDVAMAMITGGFGFADSPSPAIVYSNIVWGHIITLIPSFSWITNYSIVSLSSLIIIYTSTLAILYYRFNKNIIYPSLITTAILLFAIVNPQFTINASLLMVMAVFFTILYSQNLDKTYYLIIACTLAILSFLIRLESFLLITLLALPILPWKIIMRRKVQIYFAIFLTILLFLYFINVLSYNEQSWRIFLDRRPYTIAFSDYFIDTSSPLTKQLANTLNYTENDFQLLRNWFFIDLNITDPEKLYKIINTSSQNLLTIDNLKLGIDGLKFLFTSNLILFTLLGMSLIILVRKNTGYALLGLSLIIIFTLAFTGRPPFIRIYYPILILWIIFGIYNIKFNSKFTAYLFALLLSTQLSFTIYNTNEKHITNQLNIEYVKDATILKEKTFFAWGATFPLESLYPIIQAKTPIAIDEFSFYWLSPLSLTPNNSLGYNVMSNQNFIQQQLISGHYLFSFEYRITLLEKYCNSRINGTFKKNLLSPNLFYVKCSLRNN